MRDEHKDDGVIGMDVNNPLKVMGLPLFFLYVLVAQGCADYSAAGDSLDRSVDAQQLAQREAANDFTCSQMTADRVTRPVRERDWQEGVFSEYLVTVKGCGQTASYRVTCREGSSCAVAE